MNLPDMHLIEPVQTVARELQSQWPTVVFTRGRRDREGQASDMAANVAVNRQWIAETYATSPASMECQMAVDSHPEARLPSDIAAVLLEVLNSFTDDELRHLSIHFLGLAFDCAHATVPNDARAWLAARAVSLGGKVLFVEGGIPKVHFQAPAIECE